MPTAIQIGSSHVTEFWSNHQDQLLLTLISDRSSELGVGFTKKSQVLMQSFRSWCRFLTMKWSNRIAQGFSPGWGKSEDRPESGDRVGPFLPARPSQTLTAFISSSLDSTTHIRSPLSGLSWGVALPRAKALGNPGLKPWAILLDHFMVKNRRPPIDHQLLTTDYDC